jgi:hypothetical protein
MQQAKPPASHVSCAKTFLSLPLRMMRIQFSIYWCAVIALLCPHIVPGQHVYFSIEAGKASFGMSEMKAYQAQEVQAIKDTLGVDAHTVYNFPGYRTWGGKALFVWKRHQAGIHFSWLTTGGRVQYEDYSGFVTSDKILHSLPIDLTYLWSPFNYKSKMWLFCGLGLGYATTSIDHQTGMEIYNVEYKESSSFQGRSAQWLALPQVKLEYVQKWGIVFDLAVSYFVQLASTSQQDGSVTLKSYRYNIESKPGWDGLRLTAGLGMTLWKKKS